MPNFYAVFTPLLRHLQFLLLSNALPQIYPVPGIFHNADSPVFTLGVKRPIFY